MKSEAIVLYDSPEAASYQAWEGWVSRDGRFWGANEDLARWAGCTHRACLYCGTVNPVMSTCRPCREREMIARYATFRVEKWDGKTPLCLLGGVKFFFGQEVLEWLAYHPQDVRICKCRPRYLSPIDLDQWVDELPEDDRLPPQVEQAVTALNAAIVDAGPCSWWEDAIAIDVEDLLRRIRTDSLRRPIDAAPRSKSARQIMPFPIARPSPQPTAHSCRVRVPGAPFMRLHRMSGVRLPFHPLCKPWRNRC
jgi:hypothetical protein